MERIFKIISFAFTVLLITSCNNKKEENSKEALKSNLSKSKILFCSFPDTVKVNKVIDGKLQYDVSNVDSTITSSRFLVLVLSTSVNKELANYNEVDNNALLSYVDSLNTGKFEFKAVFEKKGKQMLNIVIRDHKFLKPQKNIPRDKMILRTSDCLFSKEVYVVDWKIPDDHFDTTSNFLYTDKRKTNNIVIDSPQFNPATLSNFETKLSDYTFNSSNYSTFSKITEHYGNKVGMDMSNVKNEKISVGDITNVEKKGSYIEGQPAGYNGGEYKVDDTNGGRTLMYTALDKDMVVVNLFEGKVDTKLDNKYNFMSVIDHEGGPIGHLVNPDKKHSDIYTDQISKYGKLVSPDFLKNLQDNYKSYKKDGD